MSAGSAVEQQQDEQPLWPAVSHAVVRVRLRALVNWLRPSLPVWPRE
jgi:hypothetical protein